MAEDKGGGFPSVEGGVDDVMSLVDEVTGGPEGEEEAPKGEEEAPVVPKGEEEEPPNNDIPADLGGEEEEPPPPLDTEEEEELPEGLNEKDASAFQTMRTRISELKVELDKKPEDTGSSARITELEAQNEALQGRVAVADLAQSPEFQAKYTNPIKEAQGEIARIAKEYDIDEKVAMQATRMNRTDRAKLLRSEATDQVAVSELMPLYQELEKRITDGKKALEDHETTRQSLEAASVARAEELQGEIFSKTLQDLQGDHFLLRDSKQNPKWLEAITHNAKIVLSGKASPEIAITAALKAQVADSYKKMYIDLKTSSEATISELEKKYGKIKTSAPKIGNRNDVAPKGDKKEYKTIEDLVDNTNVR